MKKLVLGGALAAFLGLGQTAALAAEAVPKQDWSFGGIFGTFGDDPAALQRGFQVYKEVCAGCHSLEFVAFRDLGDLDFDEEEVKAIAVEFTVVDGPNDEGEMFERPGRPSDRFPAPFANSKAAAASNNGAVPPDLSLMAKARKGGPDYIHALMTGYVDAPEGFDLLEGLSYNAYFPGNQTAMAEPLFDDAVEYADGTPATVAQMSTDISTFLMWTAEPKLDARKKMGFKVILFLLVLTALLYAVKRKVWDELH